MSMLQGQRSPGGQKPPESKHCLDVCWVSDCSSFVRININICIVKSIAGWAEARKIASVSWLLFSCLLFSSFLLPFSQGGVAGMEPIKAMVCWCPGGDSVGKPEGK
ncbi:uncharacterized protein CIMG_13404 [Coccidioides immitis RS]|uniref:Uncharacterized protein n=1 Tax=Coccidioides immitis (strain RS) TaxID=246410 RepID=A0A0D8JV82_COCIM|nr:uncharacterized protein CIMG_13404 [Coccidioides immitis RS]KJF61064.1 hypothetical protein CIMG_13404 [Coccidioides immitis RS]